VGEEVVEVEPRGKATSSVVLLHGLGADGHDFEGIVPELGLSDSLATRFVFPHAPIRAVTVNGGYRMRAWYDIARLEKGAPQDEAGIRESAETAQRLIRREEERGVPASRVVLAGFSQGGAIALFAGLRHPARLAGIVALSTYLPLDSTLAAEAHPANAAVPIFMAHGTFDPVVPMALGEDSKCLILGQGIPLEWHTYPMEHSVSAEEIADLRAFLRRVLSPS
jgi:phospholipase/carboxylesterase